MANDLLTALQTNPPVPLYWALGFAILMMVFLILFVLSARAASRHRAGEVAGQLALAEAETRLEELDALRDALAFEKEEAARLREARSGLEARLAERERAMEEARQRMETDFQAIASRMLGQSHEAFLQRANETFERHQQAAEAAAEQKHKAVDELIKPMRETLTKYEQGLQEMREQSKKAQGELHGRIMDLVQSSAQIKAEAAKLSTALKSGPRTRGKWGEETLRNVVEMTGMSGHVDFTEQMHLNEGERAKRPDMVVRLPGARVIAVDAKVSLNAYLDAAEAVDDEARALCLARHGEEMWTHVRSLAAKDYAGDLKKEGSLDFVVMFIPGDNFFAAAMEARPALFRDAFDRGVLLATPTTLIAILKSIAYGWRQEKAAENAFEVAAMAKDLYTALCRMGDNLTALGKSLDQSVRRYNTAIGSIEGTVMPKARKFADYEMPGTEQPLALLEPLEQDVREVRRDRDMIVAEGADQDDLPLARKAG